MIQSLRSALCLCFQLKGSVRRKTYFSLGIGLGLLKYAVEATVIQLCTGKQYSPRDFLSPLLSNRASYLDGVPTWLGMSLVLWTLPFIWIAVAMSIRRCRDAGYSPWCGMIMLIPLANYLSMFVLSIVPPQKSESEDEAELERELLEVWQAPAVDHEPVPLPVGQSSGVIPAIAGAAAGVGYAIASTVLTVYVLGSYGAALFFGTPLVAGAVSAFLFNRPVARSVGSTLIQATLMIGCCCFGFLLVGLEGAICILMALPILLPISLMGAVFGRVMAVETLQPKRESRGMMWCLVSLPLLATAEVSMVSSPTFAVRTTVDIQASPDVVWQQVIAFPEITERPAWFFRMGIAAPLRAHIDGSGVGAKRYCHFTTGTFVEPITIWEENRRLAFNVTEQPDPMFELTPYQHIHPPHLDGAFRSTRGEFQLDPLPDGRTRPRTSDPAVVVFGENGRRDFQLTNEARR